MAKVQMIFDFDPPTALPGRNQNDVTVLAATGVVEGALKDTLFGSDGGGSYRWATHQCGAPTERWISIESAKVIEE